MGILNRTPDSFYDKGATFALDALLARADELVADGADILDVGGVKAGPGPEVTEAEELDRVIPAIEALHARFDVPVSVDTWRASVARAAYAAGAVVGNDISGFADPDYLPAAAEAGATVVATHIRLAPRVPDPEPVYDDVVDVGAGLPRRTGRSGAWRRASPPTGSSSTPASTSARRPSSRWSCCGRRAVLAGLGLSRCCCRRRTRRSSARRSTSTSTSRATRRWPPPPSGSSLGCRIVRVHDVAGTRRVCDSAGRRPARRHERRSAPGRRSGRATAKPADAGSTPRPSTWCGGTTPRSWARRPRPARQPGR